MLSHSEKIREPAAEMLGTMLLTLIGTAGNCQVVLSANTGVASSQKGDYLSLAIGWACGSSQLLHAFAHLNKMDIGVSLGAWVCAGVSGGHVNPVVCPFLGIFRSFS